MSTLSTCQNTQGIKETIKQYIKLNKTKADVQKDLVLVNKTLRELKAQIVQNMVDNKVPAYRLDTDDRVFLKTTTSKVTLNEETLGAILGQSPFRGEAQDIVTYIIEHRPTRPLHSLKLEYNQTPDVDDDDAQSRLSAASASRV